MSVAPGREADVLIGPIASASSIITYAAKDGGSLKTGADFWGNCWEWTGTQTAAGEYLIKGGSWDSSRDECRSEYFDASRDGSKGYANVDFRIVKIVQDI